MATVGSPGYSGTPLAKKLGYASATSAVAIGAPADYLTMLAPLPEGVAFEHTASSRTDLVHIFVLERDELTKQLSALRKKLKPELAPRI